jgi:tetratricopeptide (TPR) repeat protein
MKNSNSNNLRITKVKKFTLISVLLFMMAGGTISNLIAQQPDSIKVLEYYSLFSEYHKNKDYASAVPYGWKVIEIAPVKFSKWIFYKMEDCLWYLHDSSNISQEEIKAINDTIIYFYDLALKYRPEDKAYFQVRKAFVAETWLNKPAEEVIPLYEQAFEFDKDLSSYWYNRLGQLYVSKANENNDYKLKAIDLYNFLSEREPDNTTWVETLESLVENIDELVVITKKNWEANKDDLSRAWKYASTAIRAKNYQEAIIPLEFLVQKSPETINYWNQLATAYQKTDQLNKAESAYKKLIQLEPDKKEHYLNLGIVYKDQGKFAAARTQFQIASEKGNGWGLPIYYEGFLYEQAARNCSDFDAKVVFLLAQQTYRKAMSMDPSLEMARERINALAGAVPTKEDYFFRKLKSGDTIPITCVSWIGKSVTVP